MTDSPNNHRAFRLAATQWRQPLRCAAACFLTCTLFAAVTWAGDDAAVETTAGELANTEPEGGATKAGEAAPGAERIELPADAAADPPAPEMNSMEVQDHIAADIAAPDLERGEMPDQAAADMAVRNLEPGELPDEDAADVTAPDADKTEPGDAPAAVASYQDPLTDYLDAIERTEAAYSAYSTELSDLYLGLGRAHLDRDEFEDAKKAFLRGLQILRVNYGLNSPDQTHFLFSIADIESRMGEEESANKIMQNIYSINSKSFGHHDPELLPVLNRMLEWYQQRRQLFPPQAWYPDMVKTASIMTRMASIIEQDKGLGHPETSFIYRRLGQLHYFMASHLKQYGYSTDQGISFSSSAPGPNSRPDALPPSVRSHFSGGEEAFQKHAESVELDKSVSALDRAEAIAQLGDWYMIFDKPQTAGTTYQTAYNVLQESMDTGHQRETLFNQPKPLRFLRETQNAEKPGQDGAQESQLSVSMTVTKTGRIRDVQFLDPPETLEKDQLRKMTRNLSSLRFRPRLVEGLPENTEGFLWQFPVTLQQLSP